MHKPHNTWLFLNHYIMKDKVIIVLIVVIVLLFILLGKMHHINNELIKMNYELLNQLK